MDRVFNYFESLIIKLENKNIIMPNCRQGVSHLCGKSCVSVRFNCRPRDANGKLIRVGRDGGAPRARKIPTCTPGRTRLCGETCIPICKKGTYVLSTCTKDPICAPNGLYAAAVPDGVRSTQQETANWQMNGSNSGGGYRVGCRNGRCGYT